MAIVGANGPETTTMRTIAGLMHPTQGSIHFKGQDISRTPAHDTIRQRELCARRPAFVCETLGARKPELGAFIKKIAPKSRPA